MNSLRTLFASMQWTQVSEASSLSTKSFWVQDEALLDVNISELMDDSRQVTAGDAFIAISGSQKDGVTFIEQALAQGAAAVITDERVQAFAQSVIVKDPKAFRSEAASVWNGYPAFNLHMHGITGTNGKTTCAILLQKVLQGSGRKCGLSGTVYNNTGSGDVESKLTTPGVLELQRMLREAVSNGCTDFVMEVSSHALDQGRVDGIEFDTAIFTNLTQDHLDYHASMEDYFAAKLKLFIEHLKPNDGIAVVNSGDPYGQRILKMMDNALGYTATKGYNGALNVKKWEHRKEGIWMMLDWKGSKVELQTSLWGQFNLENILAVVGASLHAGLPAELLQKVLADVSIPGRFEVVLNSPALALVDYAHTPDALERVLETAAAIKTRRLITVFGCGGDRDRGKRPLMGQAAQKWSDEVILTSDNPRTEDPGQIIEDTLAGMDKAKVRVIPEREIAIEKACEIAFPGDCLVVAGKGHETYQILGENTIHFDDREVLRNKLEKKVWS